MKKLLNFLLLLCVSMGVWAQDVEIRPVYISSNSTKGANDGEHASKLVDAAGTSTKWGEAFTNGTTRLWIIVRAKNTILKSYTLVNGNDTHTYKGRRWASWTVEGSKNADENGTWIPIDTREDADVNCDTQYASTTFTLTDNTDDYNYYKITLTKINGQGSNANMQQMADLKFNVEYTKAPVNITFNVKDDNGNIMFTHLDKEDPGVTWNAPAAPSYVTYSTSSFEVPEDQPSVTFETTYTSTFPYQFSTPSNPKWYTWKMRYNQESNKRGYLYYDATNAGGYVRETQNTAGNGGAYYWALVGSEFGFKFINYAAGTGRFMAENITFNATGAEYVAVEDHKATPAISNLNIKVKGTTQKFFNDVSGAKLGYWDHSSAFGSEGSQIVFEEVSALTSFFDSEKTYVLESASGTCMNLTTVETTSASYQSIPSLFKITQTNTGYILTNANDETKKIAVSGGWNLGINDTGTSWAIAPVDDGEFYITRPDQGSGGYYLGNRNNTNEGTGIYTDQPNGIRWKIVGFDERISILQTKIDNVCALIYPADQKVRVGYPTRECALNLFLNYSTAYDGGVTADNYETARNEYNNVISTIEINLPEDGKAYYFVNYQMASSTNKTLTGNKWMVKYNDNDNTLGTTQFTEGETTPTDANIFYCRKIDGNRFIFVTKDGRYLRYYGSNDSRNGALSEEYSENNGTLTVNKQALNGSETQVTIDECLGFVTLNGYRNPDNNNAPVIVQGHTGNYNAATSSIIRFNNNTDQYSTAFRIIEATNQNVIKLTRPESPVSGGLNGKYVGTFSAPYNVELRNGVEAYTANVEDDKVVFTKLGDEGKIVPKNTGVLLYAPEAPDNITMNAVPAAVTSLPDVGNNKLIATNREGVSVPAATNAYILANDATKGVKFYILSQSERNIARNKAYLDLTGTSVRSFVFDFEDVTTDIDMNNTDSKQNDVTYDLTGRRINKAYQGIVVRNGKLYKQ